MTYVKKKKGNKIYDYNLNFASTASNEKLIL